MYEFQLKSIAFSNLLDQIHLNAYTGNASEFLKLKLKAVEESTSPKKQSNNSEKSAQEQRGKAIAANLSIDMIWSGRF